MRALLFTTLLALLAGCGASCPREEATATAPSSAGGEAPAPIVVYARIPSEAAPIGQQPVTPQPSPRAAVEQAVGVATVRVDYSSPGVRGRTVWGDLVPYGQVWRAGANAPTRIEISEPSTIFGASVPAGAYTLLVIPAESGEWTVILNRDPQGRGFQGYDAAHDVARGTVTPSDVPARERLTYVFEDTSDTSTLLALDWAGKRIAFPITFDTAALVDARIESVVGQAWRPHFNAGRYLLDQPGQEARALELLERSVAIQSTWWNEWFLARALHANGRTADAIPHAERALELGAQDPVMNNFYAPQIRAALEEWR